MISLIVRAEGAAPLTSVRVAFKHAAVDVPFTETTPRHEKTEDLVGERFQWVYNSQDAYEHIYLNHGEDLKKGVVAALALMGD